MKGSIIGLAVALTALRAFACAGAELRPRSILVLDQSEARGPFYYQLFSGFREAVTNNTADTFARGFLAEYRAEELADSG